MINMLKKVYRKTFEKIVEQIDIRPEYIGIYEAVTIAEALSSLWGKMGSEKYKLYFSVDFDVFSVKCPDALVSGYERCDHYRSPYINIAQKMFQVLKGILNNLSSNSFWRFIDELKDRGIRFSFVHDDEESYYWKDET
jgi:hypothetical protein